MSDFIIESSNFVLAAAHTHSTRVRRNDAEERYADRSIKTFNALNYALLNQPVKSQVSFYIHLRLA